MEQFIIIISLGYLLGAIWYILVDRRANRVILIPSEFIFVIATGVMLIFYFIHAKNYLIFDNDYFTLIEGKMEIVGITMGGVMVVLHAIAKDLEVRHNIHKWPYIVKKIISVIHHKLSHKLIYLSIIIMLLSYSFGEANHSLYLTSNSEKSVITIAAVMFSLAFYRNLVHGNTWRIELITIPVALVILAIKIIERNVVLENTTFVYFSFIVLALTPTLLITDRYLLQRK
jgi:hypothetical protein